MRETIQGRKVKEILSQLSNFLNTAYGIDVSEEILMEEELHTLFNRRALTYERICDDLRNTHYHSVSSLLRMLERVQTIILTYDKSLNLSLKQLPLSCHFLNDLGLDSLNTTELILEVEDVFNILVPDRDAKAMRTLFDAVEYLMKQAIDLSD